MVRDGYIYGLSLLAVAGVLCWATGTWVWSIVPVLLAAFFLMVLPRPTARNSQRCRIGGFTRRRRRDETVRIETPQGPRQRVSIFLNVFDVHVNRSPIAGEITAVRYQKGKFLNAMNEESADRNEQNIVTVQGEGMEIVFKQIAGLIARRIIFNYRQGDRVGRGERVGLIKFGSRTDIILPAEAEIRVKTGERVKGGSSIIAEMPESETCCGSDDAAEDSQREREAGDERRRRRLNSADAALAKARNRARLRRGMFILPSFFTAMNIGAGYFAITQTLDAITSNLNANGSRTHLDGRRSRF